MTDSESESDPDVVVESSFKRRRIDQSPSRPQRYFVQPSTGKRKKESKEERAFSPSAPAELDEADESDDASTASGSSDVGGVDDDAEDAAAEIDEGTMRWSALSAPATPAPGSSVPARMYARPEGGASLPGTSNFEPKEGINVVHRSEVELSNAGIAGSGPAEVSCSWPSIAGGRTDGRRS